MKLIIQLPCHNEEAQLPETLRALPRAVEGFDAVEWLVIDDGSSDQTVDVARELGVDHILKLEHNQGLAVAFMRGLEASLKLGADVIVNTDGDNQYQARYIPALTKPILEGRAQMVVGARPIADVAHFSPLKRMLQHLGSWIVRQVSATDIDDAPSGFRAIHKDTATKLYVFNPYTYTIETIIQAGHQGIPVLSVPVDINPPTRESRLIRSLPQYLWRSAKTIFRISVLYKPLKVFSILAFLVALPGVLAFLRFLVFYFSGDSSGKIQSLVIGATLIAVGVAIFIGGLLADLVAANRALLAEIRARQLRAEIETAHRETEL